jgi:hypothetical protein
VEKEDPGIIGISLADKKGDLRSAWISNPRHLLYGYVGYGLFSLFSGRVRSVYVLQWLNILLAAAGIAVFYTTARRICGSTFLALVLALSLAFCYGYWDYAVRTEAYALNNFVLILVAFCLTAFLQRDPSPWSSLALALAFSMSIAATVSNVLIAGSVTLYLLFAGIFRGSPRRFSLYLCGLALPVAALYAIVVVGVIKPASCQELVRWALIGGVERLFDFSWAAPLKFCYAQCRTVFGVGVFRQLLTLGFQGMNAKAILVGFFSLSSVALYAYMIWGAGHGGYTGVFRGSRVGMAFLVWFAAFSLFHLFWLPGYMKPLISNLIPLHLCIACLVRGRDTSRYPSVHYPAALALLPISLFVANFLCDMLPASDWRFNEDANYARFLTENSVPGDMILISGTGDSSVGLQAEYFFGRRVFCLMDSLKKSKRIDRAIRKRLDRAQAVYLASDIKRLSSSTIVGDREQGSQEYAPEGRETARFLEAHGFIMRPSATYAGRDRFHGHVMYRVERRAELH